MANWNKTCKEFKRIREMIYDDCGSKEIASELVKICEKYAGLEWDFAEEFEDLALEIGCAIQDGEFDWDEDEDNEENFNYYLNEFYDLCDCARVWLDI